MSIKELQEKLVRIIADLAIEGDDDEIKKEAIDTINELKDHINDDIESLNYRMTALDYVIFFSSQGYGSRDATRIHSPVLESLETTIKAMGGETSEELGRVSNLNNDSESENELESSSESESESEDEDIVIDYYARGEYQRFQQNISLAKRCLVPSVINFIATTGILVDRILYSIEHEERLELMSSGVLFLGYFLSIGLIFDSNRMIRSNRDRINTLLENTVNQQIIQQAQNR